MFSRSVSSLIFNRFCSTQSQKYLGCPQAFNLQILLTVLPYNVKFLIDCPPCECMWLHVFKFNATNECTFNDTHDLSIHQSYSLNILLTNVVTFISNHSFVSSYNDHHFLQQNLVWRFSISVYFEQICMKFMRCLLIMSFLFASNGHSWL